MASLKLETYTQEGTMLFTIKRDGAKWTLLPNNKNTRVRFTFPIGTKQNFSDAQMVDVLMELLSKKTLNVEVNLQAILNDIEEFNLSTFERYNYNKLMAQI